MLQFLLVKFQNIISLPRCEHILFLLEPETTRSTFTVVFLLCPILRLLFINLI